MNGVSLTLGSPACAAQQLAEADPAGWAPGDACHARPLALES
jgi:hypothetical protein